jgi:formamidopyrimidine-DNA glycosylase
MPELPDVQLFADNLHRLFANKKLLKVKVVNGNKLKDKPKELSKNLEGKTLKQVVRSGKEMRFLFEDGTILGLHLMLTGDIFVFQKKNEHNLTIVELHFEGGEGIALTDRMRNANIKLNPKDKDGIEALEVNYKYLKKALQRKTAIKNILMDQDIIRGIGNGYSDEILWATKISPYSVASAIPDEKIKELVTTIKTVLRTAIKNIKKKYPDKVNVEVKEFLKIHNKERKESPAGAPIKIDAKGMRKTYYTDEQILYK